MIKCRAEWAMPLLPSRLAVPPPPAGCVDRPRLLRVLAADAPATAVIAPAGWGKTTLLSAWARAATTPPAWLSWEPADPAAGWDYLHRALRSIVAWPDSEQPPVDAAPRLPTPNYLVRLAAALRRRGCPTTLIIDNAEHLHAPQVVNALAFLVQQAGGGLRLVLAGRREPGLPLHRWRLAGELVELSAADLAFTTAEAADLLSRQGLWLPEHRLGELVNHAEGWPAGLRLAAHTLRRQPGPTAVLARVSGEAPPLADYLAREVLDGLPDGVAAALADGSVPEWLSGDLLDALSGRGDSEQVLTDLAHAGGFVVDRGTQPPTYRLHGFLRQYLRSRLTRPYAAQLHRRTAEWLAGHGCAAQALSHALQGSAWEYATELFVNRWPEIIAAAGQHPTGHRTAGQPPASNPRPPGHATAATPWPATCTSAELALAYAVESLRSGQSGTAEAYLHLAASGHRLSTDRADRLTRMLGAARLAAAQARGDRAQVRTSAVDLLRAGPPDPGSDAIAHAALGAVHLDAGELGPAEQSLRRGLAAAEQTGLACPRLACRSRLALVHALRGALETATSIATYALAEPACPSQPAGVHLAPAYLAAAIVDLHRGHTDPVPAHLASTAALGAGEPLLAGVAAAVRADLHRQRGELDAAYAAVRQGRDSRPRSPYARGLLTLAEARLHLARDDPDAAVAVLEPLSRAPGAGNAAEARVALGLAHLHGDDVDRAAAVLSAGTDEPAGAASLGAQVGARLLEAWVAARRGDRRRCTRALERSLALAAAEGFRQPFIDAAPAVRELLAGHLDSGTAYWLYLNDLLSTTREPAPARPVAGLVEPLTDRELTVLRYLQSELSVAEIASELHLSANTVKTHLRHIYRKLESPGRRETVRHARRLRLL